MIFHWNLSDSKSPQVPRTLLILRFHTLLVSLLSLWGTFQTCQLQLGSPSPSCSIPFFSSLARFKYLFHFSFFLFFLFFVFYFHSVVRRDAKNHYSTVFFFCFLWFFLLIITWSALQARIRRSVYPRISENFMSHILQDGFWFEQAHLVV